MTIRQEQSEDIAAIRLVNEQAFGGSAEANLVDALRERGKVILSLVAVEDDRVVGHILFSPVAIGPDAGAAQAAGLAPLAVLPGDQKRGIGSALVKDGLDGCRRAGYRCAVVLGHPTYYPRFGFAPASRWGIKCEFDVPDEVFMAIELEEGALKDCAGLAQYQPEFKGM